MRFGPRNAFYLRISEHTVLPLYVYLDERHIDWMSERVLQHVLEDLRPRILSKLKEEADAYLAPGGSANAKRGSVDVYRGDTYQFGYFLRKTDPHAVLIKTRHFVAAPNRPQQVAPPRPPSPRPTTTKGKKRTSKRKVLPKRSKKPKTKGKQKATEMDEGDEAISISSDEDDIDALAPLIPVNPRRSARIKKPVPGGYQDQHDGSDIADGEVVDVDADMEVPILVSVAETTVQNDPPASAPLLDDSGLIAMDDSEETAPVVVKHEPTEPPLSTPDVSAAVEAVQEVLGHTTSSDIPAALPDSQEPDEDKSKLMLQLKYRGFNIHGRCLCVIVEPYPPMRSTTKAPSRAPSLAPNASLASRASSIAPPDFVGTATAQRARTPLFLPEYDRERSVTPAPYFQHRSLPPVPLFNENAVAEDSDSDEGGMMDFSQLLTSVGQHQAGMVEDDDEIDGAVFFGDADETREL